MYGTSDETYLATDSFAIMMVLKPLNGQAVKDNKVYNIYTCTHCRRRSLAGG